MSLYENIVASKSYVINDTDTINKVESVIQHGNFYVCIQEIERLTGLRALYCIQNLPWDGNFELAIAEHKNLMYTHVDNEKRFDGSIVRIVIVMYHHHIVKNMIKKQDARIEFMSRLMFFSNPRFTSFRTVKEFENDVYKHTITKESEIEKIREIENEFLEVSYDPKIGEYLDHYKIYHKESSFLTDRFCANKKRSKTFSKKNNMNHYQRMLGLRIDENTDPIKYAELIIEYENFEKHLKAQRVLVLDANKNKKRWILMQYSWSYSRQIVLEICADNNIIINKETYYKSGKFHALQMRNLFKCSWNSQLYAELELRPLLGNIEAKRGFYMIIAGKNDYDLDSYNTFCGEPRPTFVKEKEQKYLLNPGLYAFGKINPISETELSSRFTKGINALYNLIFYYGKKAELRDDEEFAENCKIVKEAFKDHNVLSYNSILKESPPKNVHINTHRNVSDFRAVLSGVDFNVSESELRTERVLNDIEMNRNLNYSRNLMSKRHFGMCLNMIILENAYDNMNNFRYLSDGITEPFDFIYQKGSLYDIKDVMDSKSENVPFGKRKNLILINMIKRFKGLRPIPWERNISDILKSYILVLEYFTEQMKSMDINLGNIFIATGKSENWMNPKLMDVMIEYFYKWFAIVKAEPDFVASIIVEIFFKDLIDYIGFDSEEIIKIMIERVKDFYKQMENDKEVAAKLDVLKLNSALETAFGHQYIDDYEYYNSDDGYGS
jgi:hypothetical protein